MEGGTLKTSPPKNARYFTATVVRVVRLLALVRNVLMVTSVMVIYFCFSNLRFLQGRFLGWFKGRYLNEP